MSPKIKEIITNLFDRVCANTKYGDMKWEFDISSNNTDMYFNGKIENTTLKCRLKVNSDMTNDSSSCYVIIKDIRLTESIHVNLYEVPKIKEFSEIMFDMFVSPRISKIKSDESNDISILTDILDKTDKKNIRDKKLEAILGHTLSEKIGKIFL